MRLSEIWLKFWPCSTFYIMILISQQNYMQHVPGLLVDMFCNAIAPFFSLNLKSMTPWWRCYWCWNLAFTFGRPNFNVRTNFYGGIEWTHIQIRLNSNFSGILHTVEQIIGQELNNFGLVGTGNDLNKWCHSFLDDRYYWFIVSLNTSNSHW